MYNLYEQKFKPQSRKIEIKPIKNIKVEKEESQILSGDEERNLLEHKVTQLKEELGRLQRNKEIMLKKAHDDIAQAKSDWEIEKEELIVNAKRDGYKSGFEQGEADSKRANESLYTEANEIVLAAKKDYHQTLDQSDKTIVQLAIRTAEKIIKQELKSEPESYLSIIEHAIKEIKDQSVISIYLHPRNYQYVIKQKEELIASLDGNITISIYTDNNLCENSCHIEHPLGKVDVSIDTQLDEIHKALIELVKENKS